MQLINGHLFGAEGDNLLELFPMKNNTFKFYRGNEEEAGIFTYTADEKGKIKGLSTINPRGVNIVFKKIKE